MGSNRQLTSIFHKEQRRRRFSYTRTKATIGFLLSLTFSIIFTPFFERYGSVMVRHAAVGIYNLFADDGEQITVSSPSTLSTSAPILSPRVVSAPTLLPAIDQDAAEDVRELRAQLVRLRSYPIVRAEIRAFPHE